MSTSSRLAKIEERMLREPAKIRPPWMTVEQVRGTDLYRLPEFWDLPEELKDRASRDFTEEEIATELKEQRIIMVCRSYAEDADPDELDDPD